MRAARAPVLGSSGCEQILARDEVIHAPTTIGLQILLWVAALIYGLGGLKEMCDDFLPTPKWRVKFLRGNAWATILHITGTKMHAAVLVILGYIAVNGLIEGGLTRSEFEIFFLLSALMMATIWMTMVPSPMYFVTVMTKPVFFFLLVLSIGFSNFVRPQVLVIAAVFNVYGILVRAFSAPVAYERMRTCAGILQSRTTRTCVRNSTSLPFSSTVESPSSTTRSMSVISPPSPLSPAAPCCVPARRLKRIFCLAPSARVRACAPKRTRSRGCRGQ